MTDLVLLKRNGLRNYEWHVYYSIWTLESDVVTDNSRHPRLTVEALAADCLDVRELYKAGAIDGGWITLPWAGLPVARYPENEGGAIPCPD